MTAIDTAIAFARAQLGKPYLFGATGPNAYDCSGLVFAAYKAAGVSIGRTTYQQIFNGREIARTDLVAGDLLFPDSGHVQLYVGSNRIIEAPHTGTFVREQTVNGFWRARRVVEGGATDPNGQGVILQPVNAADDLLSKLPFMADLETGAKHLTDATFLRRIGVGLIGLGIIGTAVVLMNRESVIAGAKTAGKVAVKVGEVAAL